MFRPRFSVSASTLLKRLLLLCLLLSAWVVSYNFFPGSAQKFPRQDKFDVESEVRQKQFNELIEKAQKRGSVRVIVGLPVEFQPEGYLSESRQIAQRDSIRQAQDVLLARLAPFAVQNVYRLEFIPFIIFAADAAALETMKNAPEVVSITEDLPLKQSLAESLPIVGAPGGVANGFSGAGQAIAILDTGVDKNHPMFAGKVVSEACYAFQDPTILVFTTCPGGIVPSTAVDSGVPCNIPAQPTSDCGHGTYVAGVAAGRDTAANRFGVAKDASIISIQVFSRIDNPALCNGLQTPCLAAFTSNVIAALEQVYALRTTFNIASVNISIGFLPDTDCDTFPTVAPVKPAIDNLRSVNIASVAASGNRSSTNAIDFPACISTAIGVGATRDGSGTSTPVNTVSSYSNSADILNLLAPGDSISTAAFPGGGYTSGGSGTSLAAPHVAGAWAILKQQQPNATVSEILTALTTTGRFITDTRAGANNRITPRIRIDSASQQIAGTNCVRVPINLNQTVNSSLDAGDCSAEAGVNRDLYSFNGTAGQSIVISMTSMDFDASLYLLSPNGRVIAANDNGGGTNARIPAGAGSFVLPDTGNYTIVATKSGSAFQAISPSNENYQLNLQLPPTAAAVTIGGRVLTGDGHGIFRARVALTNSTGETRFAYTNQFGFYRFAEIPVGETYVFEVSHKRFQFIPRAVFLTESLDNLNFTALP